MRYLKRAEGRSNTRFYWHNDLATIDKAIDKLIQLHRMRWQGRGSRHSFSSDRYVAFHRAVMKRLAERDELALQCFEHDGEIIAMQYGYLFRGRLYDFQGGFNPDYASLRPGRVLTAWALRDAIERGFREYDFLKGDYQHKLLWTRQVRETEYIRAFGCGWRGRMAYLRHGVLPGLKRRIRQFRSWTQATVLANISTICDPGWVSGV
jgi:CelD/BcsL family acetyltransferase involved in cellulose biosynthesis